MKIKKKGKNEKKQFFSPNVYYLLCIPVCIKTISSAFSHVREYSSASFLAEITSAIH